VEKEGWKRRAGMWYEQAIGQGIAGLTKAKIEKRLAEIPSGGGTRPPVPTRDVAPGSEIPLGQWIDVLRWVDPAKDSVKPGWKWEGSALVTRPGGDGKTLGLPLLVEGGYDLAMDLTQPDKGNLNLVLPVGSRNVNVISWPGGHGLSWVDGREASANPTFTRKSPVVLGRRHRLVVSVRPEGDQASIGVTMDGVPVIQWRGAQRSLAGWERPDHRVPNLGTFDANVIWHRVYFRLVSGKATRIVRP